MSETTGTGAEQGGVSGEVPLGAVDMTPTDLDRRIKIVAAHLIVAMAVLALWAAADAWQAVTGLAIASVLSVGTALVAGVVLSTMIHEWGHLAGARAAKARYTIPDTLGLFVFNYDFRSNSVPQFLTMSYGGQLGGAAAIVLIWLCIPFDTAGRAMLFSASVGAFVFAAMIEWPVLARTRVSGNPAQELGRIDKQLLYRSGSTALVVIALLWLVVA
jgi:hypothetical protein